MGAFIARKTIASIPKIDNFCLLFTFNQNTRFKELQKKKNGNSLGACAVVETRFFMKASRTNRDDAIFTFKAFKALALVRAIYKIPASGAVLTRRQDARVV